MIANLRHISGEICKVDCHYLALFCKDNTIIEP